MARMPLPYLVHKNADVRYPVTPSQSGRSQLDHEEDSPKQPVTHSKRVETSRTASELVALGEANYQLNMQITELEANTERAEREGKKKLRKLERELKILREELIRSEQRTQSLEDSQRSLAASVKRAPLSRRDSKQLDMEPLSPRGPAGLASPYKAAFSQRSESEATGESDSRAAEAKPQQSEIVDLLVAKIEELQFANETFAGERDVLLARLASAQNEVDDIKRQCEELEDQVEEARGEIESSSMTQVGMTDLSRNQDEPPSSPESPRRARGNQGIINAHHRVHKRYSSVSFSASDTEFGGLNRASHGLRNSRGHSRASSVLGGSSRRQTLDSELRQSWVSGTAPSSIFDHEPFGSPGGRSDMTADTTSNVIAPGSLLEMDKPNPDTYEAITAAVDGMAAVWEDEDGFGSRPPPRPSRRQLRGVQWAHEGQHTFPESDSPERLRIEAPPSATMQQHRMNILRRRHYRSSSNRHGSMTLQDIQWEDEEEEDEEYDSDPRSERVMTRREMALRRLELATAYDQGHSDDDMDELECDHGLSHDYSEDDFDDNEDYEHVSSLERTKGDYYPMTLRARYHPRMIVQRATDSLVEQANWVVMYVRFFAVLALAVAFALWQ